MRIFLIFFGFVSNIAARELLLVRGSGNYPPSEMIVEGTLTGFHIDVVTGVAEDLGLHAKFITVPWKRALDMIRRGKADAITYISKTKERSEYLYFHKNNILSYSEDGFFVLKNRLNKIEYTGDFHQLQPFTIGRVAGYSYGTLFDEVNYLKQSDSAKTEDQLLNMLIKKRIDVAIGEVPLIKFITKQRGIAHQIEFLTPSVSRTPQYIAFSKARSTEKLALQFSNEMVRFKQSNNFIQLLEKYGLQKLK